MRLFNCHRDLRSITGTRTKQHSKASRQGKTTGNRAYWSCRLEPLERRDLMSVTPIYGQDESGFDGFADLGEIVGELDISAEEFDIAAIGEESGSLGGTLFEDLDGDGVRGPGEGGLGGWIVQADPMGTSGELLDTLARPLSDAPDIWTSIKTAGWMTSPVP